MNVMTFKVASPYGRQAKCRIVCFLLFITTLFFSLASSAALLVTPSRIVFEDRTRTEQVTLTNKGDKSVTYRVSFIRQNMSEDGKFLPVETDEEGLYSDKIVRYSPKQVVLAPGQSQIVRLMLRKPKGLAEGEYRSHLLLQALPETTKSDISKAVKKSSSGISVEITTIIGVSLPVIVRNGKLTTELNLSNARYVKSEDPKVKSYIAVDMNRTGMKSTYGDFRVTYIDTSGQEIIVGQVKGVAVYSPNKLRSFQIPINSPSGSDFENGSFHIAYTEFDKDEDTGLIASADIKL